MYIFKHFNKTLTIDHTVCILAYSGLANKHWKDNSDMLLAKKKKNESQGK